MRVNEQQQRVVGQLVLALHESRLLAGARDVDYGIDDAHHEQGVISVDWVEGPFAAEVAAGLAAYSAAGLLEAGLEAGLEIGAVAPSTPSDQVRAEILVSGLPVVLRACEPVGLERASRVHRLKRCAPEWMWPSPLQQEGAARDTVLWTVDAHHGTVATVVRLPIDRRDEWTESSILVVVSEEDAPAGVWLTRRLEVDRAREMCAILLRPAPPGWTLDDADDWMEAELNNQHAVRRAAAVVWRDRCVVRRWSGLRMEATHATPPDSKDEHPGGVAWSHVPSALLSSMWHPRPHRRQPPATMKVRAFGDAFTVATISITSSWCAPSQQYVSSPAGW